MKALLFSPLLLLCFLADAQPKPNIIVILADDMGWKDAGFMGSDLYETPNLDTLASEGMVFTGAYAGAGNCAPSRACLLSGQYTPRHGVYAVGSTRRGPVNEMRLEPIPNSEELAPSVYTMAEALRDEGYKTAMFGKWHLGRRKGTLPADQGFDVEDAFDPPSKEMFEITGDPKGIYRITAGACDFMEENKDKPFFIYVAHHATHMMIQAKPDRYAMFEGKKGEYQQHSRFAAMNNQLDDGVGILMRKIKELGIEKNTVVIFTSDNGGLPQSPQTPLRGFKGMYYEGGVRVPFIVRWPGVIRPGSREDTPVINEDIFPTLLEIAQGNPAAQNRRTAQNSRTAQNNPAAQNSRTAGSVQKPANLDGESLLRLFKGEKALTERPVFWHFPGYLNNSNPGARDQVFRTRPVSAIRKGDWKLLLYHEEWVLEGGRDKILENNAVELYNLRTDTAEARNLIASHPQKRDEMLDELLKTMKQSGAEMPAPKR